MGDSALSESVKSVPGTRCAVTGPVLQDANTITNNQSPAVCDTNYLARRCTRFSVENLVKWILEAVTFSHHAR